MVPKRKCAMDARVRIQSYAMEEWDRRDEDEVGGDGKDDETETNGNHEKKQNSATYDGRVSPTTVVVVVGMDGQDGTIDKNNHDAIANVSSPDQSSSAGSRSNEDDIDDDDDDEEDDDEYEEDDDEMKKTKKRVPVKASGPKTKRTERSAKATPARRSSTSTRKTKKTPSCGTKKAAFNGKKVKPSSAAVGGASSQLGGTAPDMILVVVTARMVQDGTGTDKKQLSALTGIAGASTIRKALADLQRRLLIIVDGSLVRPTSAGIDEVGDNVNLVLHTLPSTDADHHKLVQTSKNLSNKEIQIFQYLSKGCPVVKEDMRQDLDYAKNST
jgi:hypothetical protein